mmetsp:Transcript_32603/g.89946  ORF Transcript_32603/g.89946 Transcript_32603/m.89946 type:complete len:209 (-) Transcript_32603:155-781(-)
MHCGGGLIDPIHRASALCLLLAPAGIAACFYFQYGKNWRGLHKKVITSEQDSVVLGNADVPSRQRSFDEDSAFEILQGAAKRLDGFQLLHSLNKSLFRVAFARNDGTTNWSNWRRNVQAIGAGGVLRIGVIGGSETAGASADMCDGNDNKTVKNCFLPPRMLRNRVNTHCHRCAFVHRVSELLELGLPGTRVDTTNFAIGGHGSGGNE